MRSNTFIGMGKNDVMFRSDAISRIAAMCDHNECGKRSLTAAPFDPVYRRCGPKAQ